MSETEIPQTFIDLITNAITFEVGPETFDGNPDGSDSLKVPKLPSRGDPEAAGMDLYNPWSTPIVLRPGVPTLIKTGLRVDIPQGVYGRIAPRSGLAIKGIDVLAGVIDSSYLGEIGVVLINLGRDDVDIKKHDRIAQFILEKYLSLDPVEGKITRTSERGAGGFGSTGK
jgi:deoxyuridine 5'-triphosphate nucleotidohydrolase